MSTWRAIVRSDADDVRARLTKAVGWMPESVGLTFGEDDVLTRVDLPRAIRAKEWAKFNAVGLRWARTGTWQIQV